MKKIISLALALVLVLVTAVAFAENADARTTEEMCLYLANFISESFGGREVYWKFSDEGNYQYIDYLVEGTSEVHFIEISGGLPTEEDVERILEISACDLLEDDYAALGVVRLEDVEDLLTGSSYYIEEDGNTFILCKGDERVAGWPLFCTTAGGTGSWVLARDLAQLLDAVM